MPRDTFFNLPPKKQEKVMRSAIGEFLTDGFDKGNVGQIAKNAGVAKGSMYQYFADKKELFLYCVQWSMEMVMNKFDRYKAERDEKNNVFDFFYQSSKELWLQLSAEREVVIFLQDVFLGKHSSLTDESMAFMMKVSDEHVLKLIKDGQNNGSIRKDIDDKLLSLYITGVSLRIKEYLMKRARQAGEDLIDEKFENVEHDIKAMLELMKNGMGER